MNATKQKRIPIKPGNTRPPVEIREKTKERRAWLANRLAELQAQPNIEAKVVGKGSYEEISAYQVVEVEGRLRFRGHCQYCGHSQVAQDGVNMVLHGYKRPGTGYIFNECPGMNLPPLEKSQEKTEKWLAEAHVAVNTANTVWNKAKKAQSEAFQKVYGSHDGKDEGMSEALRSEAISTKPQLRQTFRRATDAEMSAYEASMRVWRSSFPLVAKLHDADARLRAAEQSQWAAESMVRHFEALLNFKYLGKPLQKEVVT